MAVEPSYVLCAKNMWYAFVYALLKMGTTILTHWLNSCYSHNTGLFFTTWVSDVLQLEIKYCTSVTINWTNHISNEYCSLTNSTQSVITLVSPLVSVTCYPYWKRSNCFIFHSLIVSQYTFKFRNSAQHTIRPNLLHEKVCYAICNT